MATQAQMDENKLPEKVREFVAAHPSRAGGLLLAVSDGLNRYEDAQAALRNSVAWQAICNLMSISNKSKRAFELPWLIDAAFHQFPRGPDDNRHTPAEVQFRLRFMASAAEWKLDRAWLRDLKGPEYEEWWDRIVAPRLEAKSA